MPCPSRCPSTCWPRSTRPSGSPAAATSRSPPPGSSLAARSGFAFAEPAVDAGLADFLTRHGRALYVRRVYDALASSEPGLARAREIYATARPTYHSVTQGVVDRIVGRP
ncbi:hypothetical protein G5V59_05910 [Nocardioides sp. W3-2-3]|nr:hypothetical protein [Nocardioides convexus]